MAYVPINLLVFTAAFSGAIAGMGASDRNPSDKNPADYSGLADVAGAFAQSFDTRWGAFPFTTLDIETIQELTEVVWQDRAPQASNPTLNPDNFTWSFGNNVFATTPSNYNDLCDALIAIVRAGGNYFAGQAIVPPGLPAILSNVNPADVGTAPVAGVGGEASRNDHVHELPFATVQSVLGTATGAISVNTQKITNVGAPIAATDAARLGDIPAPVSPANPDKVVQVNNGGVFGALEGFTREAAGRLNTLLTSFISYGAVADVFPAIDALIKTGEIDGALNYRTLISAFANAVTPIPLWITRLIGGLRELYVGGDPTDTTKTLDILYLMGQALVVQNAGQFRFNIDNVLINSNGLLQGDFINSTITPGDAAFHDIWSSAGLTIPSSADCATTVFMLIEAFEQPGHSKSAGFIATAQFQNQAGVRSQVGVINIMGGNKTNPNWDLTATLDGGGNIVIQGKSDIDSAIWTGLVITQTATGF